ncbi:MAG TPA: chromosomal replication initiator protein DnaA [Lacipirellula sp.]
MVKDESDRLSVLRRELRRTLGDKRYDLWLGAPTSLAFDGEVLMVRCTSQAELQWFRRKLSASIAECAATVFGRAPETVFEAGEPIAKKCCVEPATCKCGAESPPAVGGEGKNGSVNSVAALNAAIRAEHAAAAELAIAGAATRTVNSQPERSTAKRARWTFDDFVVGPSNRLAAQAAHQVAQHPGRFTPLLLYGSVGSGKSHLLAAVAHQVRAARRRPRVLQLTAEQFTTQFLEAMERRGLPGFRQKIRSVDVLLVDDVQFFAGKRATLEEFLYTIDALQSRGGQVVLTSDRQTIELNAVSPDLVNRISAGLALALDPPDFETRAGIVRTMAERMQMPLDQPIVDAIAQQVVGSARLLSGAINRLVAVSMAVNQPITLELAEFALIEFCRQHAPQVKLVDIQRAVCEVFGVESASLKSQRKTRVVAEPRMLAMWLARRYTRAALSEIGDFFGRRSHSTVVSAQKKFDKLISDRGQLVVGDQTCPVEEAIRRIEAKLRRA